MYSTSLSIFPHVLNQLSSCFSPVVTVSLAAYLFDRCVSTGGAIFTQSLLVSVEERSLIMVVITFYQLLCQRCSLYGASFVRMMNGSFNCF